MARYLNVQSFPACITSSWSCQLTTLSLETVFTMQDDLITALRERYFVGKDKALPVILHTTIGWVDRLHHVLSKHWKMRIDRRLHAIHHFAPDSTRQQNISACSPTVRPSSRSMVCEKFIPWRCETPGGRVLISKHIDQRVQALQQQYPTLELDLTLVSTRSVYRPSPQRMIPAVDFVGDHGEAVALVRGRRCDSERSCETVFIDEYRYERGFIRHNAPEWAPCLAFLRGIAQLYVWLRVALAWWGCYHARASELKYHRSSFLMRVSVACRTFFLIPGHVIVYGSWFPICCYSLAHTIDSDLVQMVNENVWNSFNGLLDFDLFSYIRIASIQMRNIWVLALFWKVVLSLHSRWMAGRARRWHPKAGILAIRAVFISTASSLTIFSFLRALRFRETNILFFQMLPRHARLNDESLAPAYVSDSEFGRMIDAKTVILASLVVFSGVVVLQLAVKLITHRTPNFAFCRSFYIPLSAGALYPKSMHGIFWYIRCKQPYEQEQPLVGRRSSWERVKTSFASLIAPSKPPRRPPRGCSGCDSPLTMLHWRNIQGCVRHERMFSVESRSTELWSVIRLVNIALLSDPWQLVQLYGVGRPVYLYCLIAPQWTLGKHEVDSMRLVLLPRRLRTPCQHGDIGHLDLVAVIDSSVVPWTALVDCG